MGMIALVSAALVGVGHWRIHRLQTADVGWSAPSIEGEVAVVGRRAYVFDRASGQIAIHRLSDGRSRIIEVPGTIRMALGESGEFATASLDGRLAFYSPDGHEEWARRISTTPTVTAVGDGDLAYRTCTRRRCTLSHLAATGKVDWRRPSRRVGGAAGVLLGEDVLAASPSDLSVVPSFPIEVTGQTAVQIRGGSPLGRSVTYTGSVGLVQYADVLIGISRRGATCSYQAVRAGEPLWHTSLDCSVLGAPFHPSFDAPTVYRDRLFVSYDGRRGVARVASIDTATGRARLLDVGPLGSDSTSARHLYLLPQAIVRQDGRHLTGLSVSTGRPVWRTSAKGGSDDPLDGHRLIPAVEASDGTIATKAETPRLWAGLALGRDTPADTSTFLDPRTGGVVAHLAARRQYSVTGVGDGRALVLADARMYLVDPD